MIIERTGIQERRIVDEKTATSDIASIAAGKALADAKLKAEDMDLIIVATATPDHAFLLLPALYKHWTTKAAAFDMR